MLRPALAWAPRAALALFLLAAATLAAVLASVLWDMRQARRAWDAAGSGASFVQDGELCRTADPAMVAQSFPCRKPAGEFRVFVIGSSQAMGSPYVHQDLNGAADLFFRLPNEGGISTWLQMYLQRLLPGKAVRVVNAAKGAGDLAASVATMREVAESGQADAVIVLDGNNERSSAHVEGTWLKAGSSLRAAVDDLGGRIRVRLAALAELAEDSRVPTYVLTVPVNLRDWLPQTDDAPADMAVRLALAARGDAKAAARGRPDDPLDLFLKGRALEAAGELAAARDSYLRAKDLDRSFFRMRSSWNDAVRRVRGRYARVIDMERLLSGHARGGILGSDLFLDYCHLTLAGNRVVAFEAAKRLQADLGLGGSPLSLEDVPLGPFVQERLGRLRRLYLAKRAKWRVARLLSARTSVDAVNFKSQADLYSGHAGMIAEQLSLAGQAAR